jgi:hypothetical protein
MAKQLIQKLINHDSIMIQLRNKSWKPECVLSFNMGWRILVFYPEPEAKDSVLSFNIGWQILVFYPEAETRDKI